MATHTICEFHRCLVPAASGPGSTPPPPSLRYPLVELNPHPAAGINTANAKVVRRASDGASLVEHDRRDDEAPDRPAALERLRSQLGSALVSLQGWWAPLQSWYTVVRGGALPDTDGGDGGAVGELHAAPAWHPHKAWLAACDGQGRVHVVDMARWEAAPSNSAPAPASVHDARVVLADEAQAEVYSLAWRPNSGSVLAVGCRGCVCLWSTLGAPGARPAGPSAAPGAPRLTQLLLRSSTARVTSLAWSPDGRLLAAGSPDCGGLVVWDVALGIPVTTGFAAVTLLRWSPCGSYLFAAGTSCRFFLWETDSWRSNSWESAAPVTGAAWDAAGRAVLLSVRGPAGCAPLVALHMVAQPPSLAATLMLVDVPMPPATTASAQLDRSCVCITDLAWDPSAGRLALLLHATAGAGPDMLAMYSTSGTGTSIIRCDFIGLARPPAAPAAAAEADPGTEGQADGAGAGAAGVRGAEARRASRCLHAHVGFARGALLTMQLDQRTLYNLPLYIS